MRYKIEKNTVQETLIIPLYARKMCSELYPNLYRDEAARRLVNAVDYDFSALEKKSRNLMQRFGFLEVAMRQNDLAYEVRDYHRPSDAHRSWGGQNRGAVRRCGGRTGRTRCTLCPERPVHPHGGSADRKPALGHLTQFKNSPSAQQKRTSIRKNRCPF